MPTDITIKDEGGFRYIDEGEGPTVILLHGLFGALSNFLDVISHFKDRYRIILPILPLYELPLEKSTLNGMVEHLRAFIKFKKLKDISLLGNSLGGHIALLYTLEYQKNVRALILTGSSGLFENSFGDGYPRKEDYNYIKKKTEHTFYNPKTATKALVDEVYEIVNNKAKAIRTLLMAKSAVRTNLKPDLKKITVPVKLIWGKQDSITPAFVATEFNKLLPQSELTIIDKCGHVPMMEQPKKFNSHLSDFLERVWTYK